jgi:hypothetical protein
MSVNLQSKHVLIVPLTCYHAQIGARLGTQIDDHVISTINICERLVKRYIKHRQLIIITKQALQEGLVAQRQTCQIVVRAVDKHQPRATINRKRSQIVIRAHKVNQSVALSDNERLHIIVRANKRTQRWQIREYQITDLVVIDIEIL